MLRPEGLDLGIPKPFSSPPSQIILLQNTPIAEFNLCAVFQNEKGTPQTVS
jgi:hypothetical protein